MTLFRVLLFVSAVSVSSISIGESRSDSIYKPLMQKNEELMRNYATERGMAPPKVTRYQYGMKLDIVKTINRTSVDHSCKVQPARMTYKDSSGNLQTLEYRKMGECRTHG